MILSVLLLTILAAPALTKDCKYMPVCCPCTWAANKAINVGVRVAKNHLKKDEECGCSLPPLQPKETYEIFIQRVFAQKEDEPCNDHCARIFKQYNNESNEKYVNRIDEIYLAFPTLPCKDNIEYWKYSEKYYTLKYGRLDTIILFLKESTDQHMARILRREKNEDFNTFINRMDCIYKAYPKLDIWRQIRFDSDCRNWYSFRHEAYNCAIRPSENIRESIATQYDRRECEQDDDISYFKRMTTRLQGESDDEYLERMSRIQSKFENLTLWYNCDYLCYTKEFYRLLYAKRDNEKCEDYFKRLTTKSTDEDFPSYAKRLQCIQVVFNDLPLWNNEKFLSCTAPFYNWLYAKKSNEDGEAYVKRITCRSPSETLENYLKRINICRWVNRGNDLFYNCAYAPIKNYYANYYSKKDKETTDSWMSRVCKRGWGESDIDYVKRISQILSVLEGMPKINLPETCLKYISEFYRLLYKQKPGEDINSWSKRIAVKLPIESDITYQTRLKYLENIYTDCRGFIGGVLKRLFGSGGGTCSKGAEKEVEVLLVKKKEKARRKQETNTKQQSTEKSDKRSIEEKIEELCGKKSNEDETSWFERLTKKSSDETPEQYIKNLNLIRKFYPSLSLWYNPKNLCFVKEYYTCLFKKAEHESVEDYYARICSKEPWESWEQTADRVALVRSIYPNISLWTDKEYFNKCTQKLYEVEYQKKPSESNEEHMQRIMAKIPSVDTSDSLWMKRIHLIQQATASSPAWYDEKCYPFTKGFFEVFYKKEEKEGCEDWLTRVLKPMTGECEDSAIKRVHLIKQTTGDCGCWTEFTFKKVASSKCLSQEYLNDIEKQFFDSATTYERIYSSSKSSSRSESSSAEEESEMVKKS